MKIKTLLFMLCVFVCALSLGCEPEKKSEKKDTAAENSSPKNDKNNKEAPAKTDGVEKEAPAKTDGVEKEAPAKTDGEEKNTTAKVGLDTGGKSLGGEPVKLEKLKFGGEGFDTEYNEALDSWTVEKWKPNEDEGNDMVIRIYVNGWDEEWPADVEGFAAKLQEPDFIDFGSKWPEAKGEAFEGGWTILGISDDGEDKETSFAVRIDKLNALCRGYVKMDVPEADRAAVRDDAIAACKSSTLGE